MRSRVRLLNSTALCRSVVVFVALQLTALSPALADEDVVCQMTRTFAVKAPPGLCRAIGGVPATAEIDASDALYDAWKANARTDQDKAYGAATAYLARFPNGRRAEELRRWSAGYENVIPLPNTPPGVAQSPPPEVARLPQPDVAPPPQPETDASDTAAAELAAWKSIANSRNPADFHAFIERYPDGEFGPSARRRLSTLEAAVRTRRLKPSAPPDDKRFLETERGNQPPLETISIDGQTYVKGREPKTIGTVPLQAFDPN